MEDTMTKAGVGCRAHLQESFFLNLFLQSGYHLPRQLWLQPPNLSGRARFWGFSTSPGFNLPPQPSTATASDSPQNRAQCSVLGLFDPPGFDFLPRPTTPPKSSTMLGLGGFRPPWASTTLDHPQQPPKSSTMLALGGFQPPGLQPPSTTPEIERDARFWGFSTSLGF